MKKTIRVLTAIILAVAIILCSAWYLFIYDREFTRDVLLACARKLEASGSHNAAAWFYNQAYNQSDDGDDVAIELAEQYKNSGNFTKAEFTLYNAISNNGGVDVYIALSKLYVEQDKLMDAVNMLNSITNPQIKEQIDKLRPAAPSATPEPGFYNQYISVNLHTGAEKLYFSTDGQYPSTKTGIYSVPITLSDGENTIQALSIAENGLVSQLSIFGYTVGGVIKPVVFADAAIESAIRTQLGVGTNVQLYTNDLWKIKSFTVPETAKNYSDLRHMAYIESLIIQNGDPEQLGNLSGLSTLIELSITNTTVSPEVLTGIGALTELKKLTLSSCGLTSIAALENAKSLTNLDLSNNTIRDISPLASMLNLQELKLQHNAVADISPLSGNTVLTHVDLSHNALTTLAPLSSLTSLVWVDANTNSITTLGDMGKLTALSYLSVSANKLRDISPLAGCLSLTELDVASNTIADISFLSKHEKLKNFNFSHNQITALPNWSTSCALVNIDGSHNQLSSIDRLSGLKHLNVVNMDYNTQIKSISALAKCPVLLEVNVYGTRVKDVKALTSQSIVVNYNPVQ